MNALQKTDKDTVWSTPFHNINYIYSKIEILISQSIPVQPKNT